MRSLKNMIDDKMYNLLTDKELDEVKNKERLHKTIEDVRCRRMKSNSLEDVKARYDRKISKQIHLMNLYKNLMK